MGRVLLRGRMAMKISKEEFSEFMDVLSEILESSEDCLKAGEKAVESLRPVVSKALRILLEALSGVYKDLEPELATLSSQRAKALRRVFADYVRAGFTKDQAFTLVLASIKPFSFTEVLKNVKLRTKEN